MSHSTRLNDLIAGWFDTIMECDTLGRDNYFMADAHFLLRWDVIRVLQKTYSTLSN